MTESSLPKGEGGSQQRVIFFSVGAILEEMIGLPGFPSLWILREDKSMLVACGKSEETSEYFHL